MVQDSSYMFVTGPDVVKTVTHESVSAEELGGASSHTKKSGVADLAFDDDITVLEQTRRLLDFLPLSNKEKAPSRLTEDPRDRKSFNLDTLIPDNSNSPYDMKELILTIIDEEDFFEIQPDYAQNIIIGFARISGETIGIVANQPMVIVPPRCVYINVLLDVLLNGFTCVTSNVVVGCDFKVFVGNA